MTLKQIARDALHPALRYNLARDVVSKLSPRHRHAFEHNDAFAHAPKTNEPSPNK
jgi:hypothetical protein